MSTKSFTQLSTEALFVIDPNWKKQNCPKIGIWLNKYGASVPRDTTQQ